MAAGRIAPTRAHVTNPFSPISNTANAAVARQVVERIHRCPAVPGSPQWRTFAESEDIVGRIGLTSPRVSANGNATA